MIVVEGKGEKDCAYFLIHHEEGALLKQHLWLLFAALHLFSLMGEISHILLLSFEEKAELFN